MRARKTVCVGLVLVSAIAGCGQKGPLYREAQVETASDAVQESRSNDSTDSTDTTAR
ncbi:lipoprotein [Marinobacter sp.]|uniref:LPS translocon maturation chaperone LptM n=1 Tax=Marinobacter sp. TaxID=50741 RepID=UPI0034A4895D